MFNIGERVVHPRYGVGEIAQLEEMEFEHGKPYRYYKISILGGSILWVPVDNPDSGLRHLATRREIAGCRKILAGKPISLTGDGRVRQSELLARLKQGTIAAQSEVVRDLSAYVAHRPLYGIIAAFLDAIQRVLCQEWAIVEDIPLSVAANEITLLLAKSGAKVAGK